MDLSIVIPVFNEKGNVSELHRRIIQALNPLHRAYEVIFVDDGSDDGTFEELKHLPAPVKIIRFRRNWGQTAAMDAGIKAAKGGIIVTMDGDLQNDPADIPHLIRKMEDDNLDALMVIGSIGMTAMWARQAASYAPQFIQQADNAPSFIEQAEQMFKARLEEELKGLDKLFEYMDKFRKPVIVASHITEALRSSPVFDKLKEHGVIMYPTPERGARVLAHLVQYSRYLNQS